MKGSSDIARTLEKHEIGRRGLIKGAMTGGLALGAIGTTLRQSAGASEGQYRFRLQSFLGPGWIE